MSALRRPVLSSVSSAGLAHAGIRLQPPTSSAMVSQEAAERAAVRDAREDRPRNRAG